MLLLEYEAKEIIKSYGIDTPKSRLLSYGDESHDLSVPVVLKSQVPAGGRGKLGGVVMVEKTENLAQAIDKLKRTGIKGFYPSYILAEEPVSIDSEIYLSLLINREKSCIEIVANMNGGMDVETQHREDFFQQDIASNGDLDRLSKNLVSYLKLSEPVDDELTGFLHKLLRCFVENDMILLEINPLSIKKGAITAVDCKVNLDQAAKFRHPDWNFQNTARDNNFVELNNEGNVATIANGAGLAMATVDAVKSAGHVPANFLDIGGAATVETIAESFRKITLLPAVKVILINIFGGIVQCDTVAKAIVEAKRNIPNIPSLLIRLSGTNADIAKVILQDEGIHLYDNLDDMVNQL